MKINPIKSGLFVFLVIMNRVVLSIDLRYNEHIDLLTGNDNLEERDQ